MSFVNPFLNPVESSQDAIDAASTLPSTVASLAMLAPIAIGGAYGMKSMSSNEGGFLKSFATNSMKDMGVNIGNSLRAMQMAKRQVQEESAQRFRETLLESGKLKQKIQEGVGRAVEVQLMAVTELLDDPASGIDDTNASVIKERLRGILLQVESGIEETARVQLEDIVDTLKTSSVQMELYEKYHRRATRAKEHLAAPNISLGVKNEPFQTVDMTVFDNMSMRRKNDAMQILDMVHSLQGRDRSISIDLLGVQERGIGGTDPMSVYARITRGRNKPIVIPLTAARGGPGDTAPVMRAGNALATSYAAPQYIMDASEAEKLIAKGRHITSSGLMQRPELHFASVLLEEARQQGGIKNVDEKKFSNYMRTFFERLDRVAAVDPEIADLTSRSLATRTSKVALVGMDRLQDPGSFRSKLAVQHNFESGASAEVRELPGGGRYSQIGLATNSTVISNQRIGVSGNISDIERRVLTPVVAREGQLYDRTGVSFVTRKARANAFTTAGEALEVRGVMGAIGKNVLLDFGSASIDLQTGKATRGISAAQRTGLSEGQLYMSGTRYVRQTIQPAVIDPNAMTAAGKPMMSRKLLNALIGEGTFEGTEQAGRIHIKGRENIARFFNEYGTVLGTSGAGDVRVKPTPFMEELMLEAIDYSPGQSKIHMGGTTVTAYGGESGMATGKVFGIAGKGMTVHIGDEGVDNYLARAFGGNATLKSLGFGAGSTNRTKIAIATGDTLKKAPSFIAQSMVSSLGMAIGESDIDTLMATVGVDRGTVFDAPGTPAQYQSRYLMGIARNVGGVMQSRGVSAKTAGIVMAGIYQMAAQGRFGLDPLEVARMVQGFGSEATASAQRGVGFARHTFMSGPQANMYGANLASLEPRMFQQVAYQLRNMYGFTQDATNDFMTALMARKLDAPGEMAALREMITTQRTLVGNRLEVMTGKPKVGVQQFVEAGREKGGIAKLIRQYSEGFVLDITDTEGFNPQASQRLLRFSQEAFGGSSLISFAGSDILDQIKGTTIKTLTGEDTEIGGQFERTVTKFAENIDRVLQSVGRSDQEIMAAKQGLASFRTDMAEVFAGTFKRLMSGKIRGSAFVTGVGVDLAEGVGAGSLDMNEAMKKAARGAAKLSKGQYGLANYQGFIDSMREFAGGAEDEFIASGMKPEDARKAAGKEAGERLMRFFTGMETGAGPMQGVTQIIGRHPTLGLLHSAPIETFRDPREILSLGAKVDPAMQSILSTPQGIKAAEKYIERAGLNIAPEELTFQQIRQTSISTTGGLKKDRQGRAARRFFNTIAKRMDTFFGSEGGGHIAIGKTSAEIHYANTGSKRSIDMSIASAMGGDFDGDQYFLINPAGENRRRLSRALRNPKSVQNLNRYRMTRNIYFEEAKRGISAFAESLPEVGDISTFVMEGVKKEELATNIGPVDLSLDRIRFGIMQAEGMTRDKEKLLAMMDVLEETMTIKGKKLPRGVDLSTIMTKAVGLAAEGDYTAFENVLKVVGFRDSEVLAEGATLGKVSGPGITDEMSKTLSGMDISVSGAGMRQTMMSALEHSKILGVDRAKTLRQLVNAASGHSAASRARFEAITTNMGSVQASIAMGNDLETVIASTIGSGTRRASSAAAKFDKRLLGPAALGIAGALGFGMVAGGEGHSYSPMMMPGEVIQPEVQRQIAGGNIFNRPANNPDLESLQAPGNQYADIGNRPIHQRSTYTKTANAYSMRGEVTSLSGISLVQNYMNMARATGSVTINDTRRPITANYLDRMMDA